MQLVRINVDDDRDRRLRARIAPNSEAAKWCVVMALSNLELVRGSDRRYTLGIFSPSNRGKVAMCGGRLQDLLDKVFGGRAARAEHGGAITDGTFKYVVVVEAVTDKCVVIAGVVEGTGCCGGGKSFRGVTFSQAFLHTNLVVLLECCCNSAP